MASATVEEMDVPKYALNEPAREAVINVATELRLIDAAYRRMLEKLALGEPGQIGDDILSRYGFAERQAVEGRIGDPFPGRIQLGAEVPLWRLWITKSPDFYALRFIEALLGAFTNQYAYIGNDASRDIRSLRQRINQLLRGAGGVYQLTDRGLCVSTDEPLFAAEVVEPAIAALASANMSAVRSDFDAARAALASSTPEGNERAMIKASAAIEGTLAVLMERLGVPTSKDSVDARVKALSQRGTCTNTWNRS